MAYILPGIGGQVENVSDSPYQMSPLLNTYSPRLFGAPPQLTHLNDMRLMSSSGSRPGPVGDFYLNDILRDAQVANIIPGRALFTGGMSSIGNALRNTIKYTRALAKYNIYDTNSNSQVASSGADLDVEQMEQKMKDSLENDTGQIYTKTVEIDGEEITIADLDANEGNTTGFTGTSVSDSISAKFGTVGGALATNLLISMSVQQPFYTFDSDWYSYINNVKMMINTGVVMLGLQRACVRIGDKYLPLGMDFHVSKDTDVWSNYRFITPTSGLGTVTAVDTLTGDSSQYVSFMIDPLSSSESYNNESGESTIYSQVINKGSSIGSEIAFISNSSKSAVDDALIEFAGDAINAAEEVLSSLTLGAGRFTAAVAGSMARTYIGDHTIYPHVYKQSSANTGGVTLKTRFTASSGDPYAFLIDCWVPLCFALGLVLPAMSKNNASGYSYPPLVQCNIPGIWGTTLGIVETIDVAKNPDGKSMSIHGFPTSIEVSIKIKDLQQIMVSSGMDKPAVFLNNNTMFDYIAQSCGCDKYKPNGAIRLVSKLALAASASNNMAYNIGSAVLSDITSWANKTIGTGR